MKIICKPADKGSSVVIQNTQNYINEANRQLTVELHYKKLTEPTHPQSHNQITQLLSKLKQNKYINNKEFNFFKPQTQARPRKLYFTPKIHKNRTTWPNQITPAARPIISDCSSDTYNLSTLLDHFLAPLSIIHPSYVKDTPHFLNRISGTKVPNHCYLITLDVTALYTNINNIDGLHAVKQILLNNPVPGRPDKEFLELLQISLNNNDFTFNKQWFLQIFGTSMGKRFSPRYADIFMAYFEKQAQLKTKLKPLTYFRFLDDIFLLWIYSLQEFQEFLDTYNTHHPTIKFTANIQTQEIEFLDVTIFKGKRFQTQNILDTKVHFKKTDTHELLHKNSYHPKHTFSGILKSQIIRFSRICNNEEDRLKANKTLFTVLHLRGYSKKFTRQINSQTMKAIQNKNKIQPVGTVKHCTSNTCKLHPHLLTGDTFTINNKKYAINNHMNCSTSNVIYMITCTNCNLKYIGHTSCTLRTRFNNHKSTIIKNVDTKLANHINNCTSTTLNATNLPITIKPIEIIPRDPNKNSNLLKLLQAETEWIYKLKTYQPFGINDTKEAPPPIPFTLKYFDNTNKIKEIVKQYHNQLGQLFPKIFRNKLLWAHMRNKNIKDYIISTNLHNT